MTFEIPTTQDIPDGSHKATLLGVTVKDGGKFTSPSNPTGSYRMWDWLVEIDGEGVPFSDTTSMNTGPKTVAYARLTALLGAAPKAGEKLETPTGKTVLLQFGRKENGYPKVEAVLPYVQPAQVEAGLPR